MTKQLSVILLLLAFMAQTFNKAIIVLDFYKNQSFIAAVLCINRDKPTMNCEGTCQLSKKLKEEKNKEKNNPERKLENKSEILPDLAFTATICKAFDSIHTIYPPFQSNPVTGVAAAIFHPPC